MDVLHSLSKIINIVQETQRDTCCRANVPPHCPYGLLHPLLISKLTWLSIYLHFIIDLRLSKGFDAILTLVDQFMKRIHFIPCIKRISSKQTTNLL